MQVTERGGLSSRHGMGTLPQASVFFARADGPYRSRRDRSLIDGTFELFRYAAGRWPVIGAGAIALGVLGAVAGDAVGDQLDDTLSHGLPTDELYVYNIAYFPGTDDTLVSALK